MPTFNGKITKRSVDALKPSSKGDIFLWDIDITGFGLRVKSSGKKSYLINYRNGQGRWKRLTLGPHGTLTPDEARTRARKLLSAALDGDDPVELREAGKQIPTVSGLFKRYISDYAEGRKKPSSIAEDRRLYDGVLFPELGNRRVDDITHADIARVHASLVKTPFKANRFLSLTSKLLNLAEQWGFRPQHSNPVRHIKKFPEPKRERFLTTEEFKKLGEALADAEEKGTAPSSAVNAIRLLALTGCRRSEILSLKWDYVDYEHFCLRLPDSKTGLKTVALNSPAIALLKGRKRTEGNDYVFPGRRNGKHLRNLQKYWADIRRSAGLEEVRINDLRHSFASVGVALGESLFIIGKQLGHSQATTTERYAHLSQDPIRAAGERVGTEIATSMNGSGTTGEKIDET